MKFIDLTGKKFGRLTVIKQAGHYIDGHIQWLCKCDCGNEVIAVGNYIKRGLVESCGCLRKERLLKSITKHGLSKTKLDNIYFGMKSRCYNVNEPAYKWYGARNITICEEWLNDKKTFFEWAINNGYNENLTIDRIDVNGNYEPNNCRWVTAKQQSNNRRTNHNITYNGETHNIAEWSEITGLSRMTIICRLKRNWSIEKTLTTPKMKNQFI